MKRRILHFYGCLLTICRKIVILYEKIQNYVKVLLIFQKAYDIIYKQNIKHNLCNQNGGSVYEKC